VAASWQRRCEVSAHGMATTCTTHGGREAGGARRSSSWRGRDVVLGVGVGARSERHPGAHVQANDRVVQASSRRCGLGPV
jgi:hypothetical protein